MPSKLCVFAHPTASLQSSCLACGGREKEHAAVQISLKEARASLLHEAPHDDICISKGSLVGTRTKTFMQGKSMDTHMRLRFRSCRFFEADGWRADGLYDLTLSCFASSKYAAQLLWTILCGHHHSDDMVRPVSKADSLCSQSGLSFHLLHKDRSKYTPCLQHRGFRRPSSCRRDFLRMVLVLRST